MVSTSMQLIRELESLVNQYADPVNFPEKKDGSIQIANYQVTPRDGGYLVADIFGCEYAQVNYLVSAIAIASNLSVNNNITRRVKSLDHELTKHYSDAVFYEHAINKAKSWWDADIRQVRLDRTMFLARETRSELSHLIFNSLRQGKYK